LHGGSWSTPAPRRAPITMQQLASSTHLRGTGLAARRGAQSQPARLSRCVPGAVDAPSVLVVMRAGAMGVPRLPAASRRRRHAATVAPAPQGQTSTQPALLLLQTCRGAAVVVRAEEGKKGGFFGEWVCFLGPAFMCLAAAAAGGRRCRGRTSRSIGCRPVHKLMVALRCFCVTVQVACCQVPGMLLLAAPCGCF